MLENTNKALQFYGNMASLKGGTQQEEERSESSCQRPLVTNMEKKLVMRRGMFLQMGNVDGEDVASR